MARQAEEPVPATEQTDELPALSADAFRPTTGDALDRSIEALRETLESAERRWRTLESRIEDQDRNIRELKEQLRLAASDRFEATDPRLAGVPELTEIVSPAATVPAAAEAPAPGSALVADADPAALLARIAALEAYIAGQNDHLRAVETELDASTRRIAALESARGSS